MNRIVEKRREEIESLLVENSTMKVSDLAAQLHVTPETIRKDLDYLERRGFLTRKHGYCTIVPSSHEITPVEFRMQENAEFRKNVSEAIFPYIEDGMLIFMGSSSNTIPLARMLQVKKRLTIYTNSIEVAERALGGSNRVILLGGNYNSVSRSTSGEATLRMVHGIYFDIGIFGMDGCKDMDGPASFSYEESVLVNWCVQHSRFSVLPSETKKFNISAGYQWAKFTDFDRIITGTLTQEQKEKLKGLNITEIAD